MRKIWCPNHDTGGVFSRFHTKSGSVLIHVIILLIVNEAYHCDRSWLFHVILYSETRISRSLLMVMLSLLSVPMAGLLSSECVLSVNCLWLYWESTSLQQKNVARIFFIFMQFKEAGFPVEQLISVILEAFLFLWLQWWLPRGAWIAILSMFVGR